MKFTQATLLETPRRKNEGWTTYQARKLAGVSIRRVNQVWQSYLATGDDTIAVWNAKRPNDRFSLIEITPFGYDP